MASLFQPLFRPLLADVVLPLNGDLSPANTGAEAAPEGFAFVVDGNGDNVVDGNGDYLVAKEV